ncbi:MAG: ABC transporter substrate-binding protein [Actinomycetota bacterium]|nr:ABC transporter substrate-binding protein [Actinomycetota bacterium]
MKRRSKFVVAAVSLAMAATACGSSGGGGTSNNASGNSGSGSSLPNQHYNLNNSGAAVKGGVLTMLGTGDVDYMDPNVTYYSVGYLAMRFFSRSLYTYPATQNKTTTPVPDLATAMPALSNGGKTYSITIRKGAMWNSSPARQVTAADVVRGIQRTCNPAQPFGGEPDFSSLIVGYQTFCDGFGKVAPQAPAMKAYMDANQISGVSVSPSDPLTVQINLTKPTSYFDQILGLNCFDPAPIEYENYVPAGNDLAQHTLSDGPYQIASYTPARSIDFVRNPAWNASTDPVRKAYVNEVKVSETGNQQAVQQQILTNTPAADMEWDSYTPPNDIPGLLATNDKRLSLQSEFSTNPYVIFNTQSPNNTGALAKVQVRQALEYAISRTNLIQDFGGPQVDPPLTQVLPPGINGSSPAYNMYPTDPAKAKQLLAAAGFPNGLTLKFLYRPAQATSAKAFQTVQADLGKIGINVTGVGVPNADFYTKYLQVPTTAKSGVWDVSLAGWSPDWYGDASASFFPPLFDGRVLPPTSSNFGLFNDPTVNADIDKALAATTPAQAGPLWHQADVDTMKAAAVFPITDPNQPIIAGSQVHNTVYLAIYQQFDPTNVWLNP